jgi:hypothetical protein
MENTSCGDKCPFVKTGFCKEVSECPNYVESWWREGQSQNTKLVMDCVPKRLMIQLAALQARFEGVQAATEQVRNETCVMKGHFEALLTASRQHVDAQEQQLSINIKKELPDEPKKTILSLPDNGRRD